MEEDVLNCDEEVVMPQRLERLSRLDVAPRTFELRAGGHIPEGQRLIDQLEQLAGAGGFSGNLMDPKPVELPAPGSPEAAQLLEHVQPEHDSPTAGTHNRDDPPGTDILHRSLDMVAADSVYHGIPGASYELIAIENLFQGLCVAYHRVCRGRPSWQIDDVHLSHLSVIYMILNAESAMHMSGQSHRIRDELSAFVHQIRAETYSALERRLATE